MGWRIHRGDRPSAASNWTDRGRVEQEASGEPATQFETPGRLLKEAEADGKRHGGTRTREEIAVGKGSGAVQSIKGKIAARKAALTVRARRQEAALARQVATKESRLAANKESEAAAGRKAKRLTAQLPEAKGRVREQARRVEGLRARYEGLSRSAKGFIGYVGVVAAIETSVVAFDGGSLYSALERAGFSDVAVWFLSGAVPLLIGAVNHSLGVLAGAVSTKLGANRLKVAVATFAAGFGMAVTTFLLLAAFRSQATSGQNEALKQWASGNLGAHPSLIISPLWLGPAQIAGSIAAIIAVCLFTVAKPGRELRREIAEAAGELSGREAEVAAIKQRIEAAHQEQDAHREAHQAIVAEVAEVSAELERHGGLLDAELDAEAGLAEAAEGRLRTIYHHERQLYENGGVVRMALPSVFRFFGRWFTPGSSVRQGGPAPSPSTNGHESMPPEELKAHLSQL